MSGTSERVRNIILRRKIKESIKADRNKYLGKVTRNRRMRHGGK